MCWGKMLSWTWLSVLRGAAAADFSDPREIQRIVAEQDKAREAEQKLNQAYSVNEWLRVFGCFFRP